VSESKNVAHADLLEALGLLESAYEQLVYVMDYPAPLGDGARGGTPGLDLYLLGGGASDEPEIGADPAQPTQDSAPGFCVTGGTHLTLQDAVRCVAGAIALRLDAAETPAIRSAYASYLAVLLAGPDESAIASADDAQSNPQIHSLSREITGLSQAGANWFAFLDEELSVGAPGDLPTMMLSLSRSVTTGTHPEWNNEPDIFDVLRRSLNGDPRAYADLFGKWAVARAFMGDRNDGSHRPALHWLGSSGRLAFDWKIAYSSLPRKVASARAIEPMGTSAVWLDLDGVPLGARLGVQIEWEEPVSFRWLVVGVDREGREVARWDVPYLERGTRVEKTLMNYEHAAGLMFIGINLGGVDLQHPFDPDSEPWEAHAYTLYLAELP
jgi:hypothetical protein